MIHDERRSCVLIRRVAFSIFRRNVIGVLKRLLHGDLTSLGAPRSRMWRRVRDEHLRNNPECAVCGRKTNLVPHHVVPVHEDPSLELDPGNLITLCEGPSFNCHLFFGHLRDWTKYNPDVRRDAREWRSRLCS